MSLLEPVWRGNSDAMPTTPWTCLSFETCSTGKFPQRRISHTYRNAMTLAHVDERHSMENE